MIDLCQDFVRQVQAVDFPPPLIRIPPIIEVLVSRFQPAKVIPLHFLGRGVVGPEEDAVCVVQKKVACPARLPA
jgi:hypothetical protein